MKKRIFFNVIFSFKETQKRNVGILHVFPVMNYVNVKWNNFFSFSSFHRDSSFNVVSKSTKCRNKSCIDPIYRRYLYPSEFRELPVLFNLVFRCLSAVKTFREASASKLNGHKDFIHSFFFFLNAFSHFSK